MQRCHDRVKETTTSTGTDGITLSGAVAGFASFSNRFILNEPIYYAIVGQTGTEWETGKGYLVSSTNFVREKVFESSDFSGTPPNITFNKVNFSAGTKDFFSTIPAERIEEIWTKGQVIALSQGLLMP